MLKGRETWKAAVDKMQEAKSPTPMRWSERVLSGARPDVKYLEAGK